MASSERAATGNRWKKVTRIEDEGSGRDFAGPGTVLIPGFLQLSRRLLNFVSVKEMHTRCFE